MSQTTTEILKIVAERIAQGLGERNEANTADCYEGIVRLHADSFNVSVVWPDGSESHEIEPEIRRIRLVEVTDGDETDEFEGVVVGGKAI